MENPKIILLVLFLITGSVFVGLSIPLIRGRIGPNVWYGFRIKRTLENPAIWYPANRYAAWQLLSLGIVLVFTAVALYFVPQLGFIGYAMTYLAVVLAGLFVNIVRSFLYLRRLSGPDAAGSK
jgi:hypothetical protein